MKLAADTRQKQIVNDSGRGRAPIEALKILFYMENVGKVSVISLIVTAVVEKMLIACEADSFSSQITQSCDIGPLSHLPRTCGKGAQQQLWIVHIVSA